MKAILGINVICMAFGACLSMGLVEMKKIDAFSAAPTMIIFILLSAFNIFCLIALTEIEAEEERKEEARLEREERRKELNKRAKVRRANIRRL